MDEIKTLTPTCEMCGTTHGVEHVMDPYDQELNGWISFLWLCPDCLQTRRDEI